MFTILFLHGYNTRKNRPPSTHIYQKNMSKAVQSTVRLKNMSKNSKAVQLTVRLKICQKTARLTVRLKNTNYQKISSLPHSASKSKSKTSPIISSYMSKCMPSSLSIPRGTPSFSNSRRMLSTSSAASTCRSC